MNYSDDPSSVRVDFFKPSGKWYTTEAVKMGRGIGGLIHEDFAEALDRHLREGSEVRLSDNDGCLPGAASRAFASTDDDRTASY